MVNSERAASRGWLASVAQLTESDSTVNLLAGPEFDNEDPKAVVLHTVEDAAGTGPQTKDARATLELLVAWWSRVDRQPIDALHNLASDLVRECREVLLNCREELYAVASRFRSQGGP